MRAVHWVAGLGLLASVVPTSAETVNVPAANQVPVVMVEIDRKAAYTEVHLQARRALAQVCWFLEGPNSPYLLAGKQRYRFRSGENIVYCPLTRGYAPGETMVLRFAPLPAAVREVSLVEGQGGEAAMKNPGASRVRYWNFLHVMLH